MTLTQQNHFSTRSPRSRAWLCVIATRPSQQDRTSTANPHAAPRGVHAYRFSRCRMLPKPTLSVGDVPEGRAHAGTCAAEGPQASRTPPTTHVLALHRLANGLQLTGGSIWRAAAAAAATAHLRRRPRAPALRTGETENQLAGFMPPSTAYRPPVKYRAWGEAM